MKYITLPIAKSCYSGRENPYRYIKVDVAEFPLPDRHKICDAIAKNWGEVNSQSTTFKSDKVLAKYYSCSGHGGFVVFSTEKLGNAHHELSFESYNVDLPCEWYIYTFEEDCMWAAFFLALPSEIQKKFYLKGGYGCDFREMVEHAKSTNEKWNENLEITIPV